MTVVAWDLLKKVSPTSCQLLEGEDLAPFVPRFVIRVLLREASKATRGLPSYRSLLAVAFFPFFNVLLSGCRPGRISVEPVIKFSKIPPAAQGGKERMDTIAGRVSGAHSGQQIVIYARSGAWWVQPRADRPFITITADSTWSTETHLGYEYAALLVNPGYQPPPTIDVVPTPGGDVAVVKVVKDYLPGNIFSFNVPAGTLTHTVRWEPGRASFKTFRGSAAGAGAPVISEREFTSGVPSPGQERVQLFFYVVATNKNPLQNGSEVVIEKFEYLP